MLHKLIFNTFEIGRQLFIEYYAYAEFLDKGHGEFCMALWKSLAVLSKKLTRSRHKHHFIITGLIT